MLREPIGAPTSLRIVLVIGIPTSCTPLAQSLLFICSDAIADILRNLYAQAGITSLNPDLGDGTPTSSESTDVDSKVADKDGTRTTSTIKVNGHLRTDRFGTREYKSSVLLRS